MERELSIGLIGVGYWGGNYLRVLRQLPGVHLKYVCDKAKDRLETFSAVRDTSDIIFTTDSEDISSDKDVKAVIIATPATSHYNIAERMLENGKNVLVEKPLAVDYNQAASLCNLSEKTNNVLMVGHIYCFNPAVNYIKKYVNSPEFGDLFYGLGLRLGLGPIREDASCTWDLATHDISMLDYITNEMPASVTAQESSFLQRESGIHDYATIQLKYKQGFQFSLTVSWYAAEKIRMWYLMGSKKMLKFDDSDKNSPLMLYDKSVTRNYTEQGQGENVCKIVPRSGDTIIPYIKPDEPLLLEIKHFIDCINTGKKPITNGIQGARVITVLEAIENSLKSGGKPIMVDAKPLSKQQTG